MTADIVPLQVTPATAIKMIRELSADTANIVIIPHGKKRARQRQITHRQIELCVQKGTIQEGPFRNQHGHWQVTMYRHAAGEEVSCVVAIEWATRLLVITTF